MTTFKKASIAQYISLVLVFIHAGLTSAEPSKQISAHLPVMTWYHPVLEPGIGDIVLLCTVTSVEAGQARYENPYSKVILRIDEPIFVHQRFNERLKNVTSLETGDFRKRTVGDRIVVFAGGPKYEGDDFLLPCWSGTASDLGLLLHSPDDINVSENDRLLEQLRKAAKTGRYEADFMEAFAAFCPAGVAAHFVHKMRMEEYRLEEEAAIRKAPDLSSLSLAGLIAIGFGLLIVVSWVLLKRRKQTLAV